jgi:hypothetical protein
MAFGNYFWILEMKALTKGKNKYRGGSLKSSDSFPAVKFYHHTQIGYLPR